VNEVVYIGAHIDVVSHDQEVRRMVDVGMRKRRGTNGGAGHHDDVKPEGHSRAPGRGVTRGTVLTVNGALGQGDMGADGRYGRVRPFERRFGRARPPLQEHVTMEADASGDIACLWCALEGPLQGSSEKEGGQGVALADITLGEDRRGIRQCALEPQAEVDALEPGGAVQRAGTRVPTVAGIAWHGTQS
jgi:hypothetical protein